jgi:hypothetical protein
LLPIVESLKFNALEEDEIKTKKHGEKEREGKENK